MASLTKTYESHRAAKEAFERLQQKHKDHTHTHINNSFMIGSTTIFLQSYQNVIAIQSDILTKDELKQFFK